MKKPSARETTVETKVISAGSIVFNEDYMHAYICVEDCVVDENLEYKLALIHAAPPKSGSDGAEFNQQTNEVVRYKTPGFRDHHRCFHVFTLAPKYAELSLQAAITAQHWAVKPTADQSGPGLPPEQAIPFDRNKSALKARKAETSIDRLQQGFLADDNIREMLIRAQRTEQRPTPDMVGFTCAEFIISCFQSAALKNYVEENYACVDLTTAPLNFDQIRQDIQKIIPDCFQVDHLLTTSEVFAGHVQIHSELCTESHLVKQQQSWTHQESQPDLSMKQSSITRRRRLLATSSQQPQQSSSSNNSGVLSKTSTATSDKTQDPESPRHGLK